MPVLKDIRRGFTEVFELVIHCSPLAARQRQRATAFMRLMIALIVAAVLMLFTQVLVEAAGPRAMVVHGESLTTPIRIDLWKAGVGVLSGPEYQGSEVDLEDRVYLQVGFFWGPEWSEFLDAGGSLQTLQLEQANWHGRLYPATSNDAPAVIYATGYGYRLLNPEAIEFLEQHSVPLAPDSGTAAGGALSPATWWFAAAALVLLLGSVFVARRRDPARRLDSQLATRGW
jgi:hypothetical protein